MAGAGAFRPGHVLPHRCAYHGSTGKARVSAKAVLGSLAGVQQ